MNWLALCLFGVPVLLFAVQLLLCVKVKTLYFRLVPLLLGLISLSVVLFVDFKTGSHIPGAYTNILLPRFLAVGSAWLTGHLIKKRMY